jgi:hypothetical protein
VWRINAAQLGLTADWRMGGYGLAGFELDDISAAVYLGLATLACAHM